MEEFAARKKYNAWLGKLSLSGTLFSNLPSPFASLYPHCNFLLQAENEMIAKHTSHLFIQFSVHIHSLMAKFSKKLVSKCIYIQILKCTETELLGQFMAAGGWTLTHLWLQDGITSLNWAFVQELLEMLLMCPVDGNRLKSNTAPRLVKTLSVNCPHNGKNCIFVNFNLINSANQTLFLHLYRIFI